VVCCSCFNDSATSSETSQQLYDGQIRLRTLMFVVHVHDTWWLCWCLSKHPPYKLRWRLVKTSDSRHLTVLRASIVDVHAVTGLMVVVFITVNFILFSYFLFITVNFMLFSCFLFITVNLMLFSCFLFITKFHVIFLFPVYNCKFHVIFLFPVYNCKFHVIFLFPILYVADGTQRFFLL
jgi:hypothetical protein